MDKSWHAMIDLKASFSILRLARYLSSETPSPASLHRVRDWEVCKFYRHLMHNANVSNLNLYCLKPISCVCPLLAVKGCSSVRQWYEPS
jgi:hypothetical protein